MEKKREFLSEVISNKGFKIKNGKLNLIISPTGTGKTTYFFNELSKQYKQKYRIVYLVDTNMLEASMLFKYNDKMKEYDKSWFNELKFDCVKNEDKIVVMSYQKFGLLLKHNDKILNDIDLLVIDEAHNLLKYSDMDTKKLINDFTYAREDDIKYALQYLNGCSNLAYNITRYIDRYNLDVVMMTATPDRIINHKPYSNYLYEVLEGYEILGYNSKRTIKIDNIKNAYKFISQYKSKNKDCKILCYSRTIESCKNIEESFKSIGLKPIVLWSLKNESHPMSNEQLLTRQLIIKTEEIPYPYDSLIINDAYQTGWNLNDSDCNLVLINTSDNDTIIQVKGRVRHDIDVLMTKSNYVEMYVNEVPSDFLNRLLNNDDKNLLVKHFDLYNKNGRPIKWRGIKEKILNSGKYKITSSKPVIDGKRISCDFIEKI